MRIKKYMIVLIVFLAILGPQLWRTYANHNSEQNLVVNQLSTTPVETALPSPSRSPEVTKLPAADGKPSTIPILMYHEISTGPDCMWVAQTDFYAQMKQLHDNDYKTITLPQAAELLAGNYNTSKMVVLTFDDGYSTFYDQAWPILQEFNQTATVFVITGLVGTPEYLTWDQIRYLASQGIEIGGHTRTHPLLPTLSPLNSNIEIAQGKQEVEAQLGQPITAFCYPTGKFDARIVEQVKTAGYTAAVTMVQRKAAASDNLLLLPRWGVYQNDSLQHFVKLIQ